jgi:hypothetical protein
MVDHQFRFPVRRAKRVSQGSLRMARSCPVHCLVQLYLRTGTLLNHFALKIDRDGPDPLYPGLSRSRLPNCLVLDVRLHGLSGPELQREPATSEVEIAIVSITGHGDSPLPVRTMQAESLTNLVRMAEKLGISSW